METKISKIEKICKNGINNKTILLLVEVFAPSITRKIHDSISKRAFDNLYYRQLFFLIQQWKYQAFLNNIFYLSLNINDIIMLLEFYHYELILKDYEDSDFVFRAEIFHILIFHKNYLSRNNSLHNQDSLWTFLEIPLIAVYKSTIESITISLALQIFNQTNDFQDWANAITFSINDGSQRIYTLCFYIGENEILISNLQYWKWAKSYVIVERYSRILLYLLFKIFWKAPQKKLISFSNANHVCRHHTIHNGFHGDYDMILSTLGMKQDEEKYFSGALDNLKIPHINPFIAENIDVNLPLFKKLITI